MCLGVGCAPTSTQRPLIVAWVRKRRGGRGGERRETGEERRGEGMDEGRVNNEGEGHTSIRRERRFFARV